MSMFQMRDLKVAVQLLQSKSFKTQEDMVKCLQKQFPAMTRDALRLLSKEAVAVMGMMSLQKEFNLSH